MSQSQMEIRRDFIFRSQRERIEMVRDRNKHLGDDMVVFVVNLDSQFGRDVAEALEVTREMQDAYRDTFNLKASELSEDEANRAEPFILFSRTRQFALDVLDTDENDCADWYELDRIPDPGMFTAVLVD